MIFDDSEYEDEEADDDDDDDVFFNMLHRFVCFSTTLPTFNSSLHLLFSLRCSSFYHFYLLLFL